MLVVCQMTPDGSCLHAQLASFIDLVYEGHCFCEPREKKGLAHKELRRTNQGNGSGSAIAHLKQEDFTLTCMKIWGEVFFIVTIGR
jgi:hypothetical protein